MYCCWNEMFQLLSAIEHMHFAGDIRHQIRQRRITYWWHSTVGFWAAVECNNDDIVSDSLGPNTIHLKLSNNARKDDDTLQSRWMSGVSGHLVWCMTGALLESPLAKMEWQNHSKYGSEMACTNFGSGDLLEGLLRPDPMHRFRTGRTCETETKKYVKVTTLDDEAFVSLVTPRTRSIKAVALSRMETRNGVEKRHASTVLQRLRANKISGWCWVGRQRRSVWCCRVALLCDVQRRYWQMSYWSINNNFSFACFDPHGAILFS
jgi:hypothetical protein